MTTLSKLPALTPGLCLSNILKFHCKLLVQRSVSSTEHGITPSQICHEIAPPYLTPEHIFGSYMWQSRVENERYSVAYFDRIRVFNAPYP